MAEETAIEIEKFEITTVEECITNGSITKITTATDDLGSSASLTITECRILTESTNVRVEIGRKHCDYPKMKEPCPSPSIPAAQTASVITPTSKDLDTTPITVLYGYDYYGLSASSTPSTKYLDYLMIDENGMDEYRWVCPNVKDGFIEYIFFREEQTPIEEQHQNANVPYDTREERREGIPTADINGLYEGQYEDYDEWKRLYKA